MKYVTTEIKKLKKYFEAISKISEVKEGYMMFDDNMIHMLVETVGATQTVVVHMAIFYTTDWVDLKTIKFQVEYFKQFVKQLKSDDTMIISQVEDGMITLTKEGKTNSQMDLRLFAMKKGEGRFRDFISKKFHGNFKTEYEDLKNAIDLVTIKPDETVDVSITSELFTLSSYSDDRVVTTDASIKFEDKHDVEINEEIPIKGGKKYKAPIPIVSSMDVDVMSDIRNVFSKEETINFSIIHDGPIRLVAFDGDSHLVYVGSPRRVTQ